MSDFLGKIKNLILYAGDIIIFYGVLVLTILLRYSDSLSPDMWYSHFYSFSVVLLIWLVVFHIAGLYDFRLMKNDINFYSLVFRTLLISAVPTIIYFYVLSSRSRSLSLRPQLFFLVFLLIYAAIFLIWRRSFNRLAQVQAFTRNVLFLGNGKDMDSLVAELNHRPSLGFRVVDYIKPSNGDFLVGLDIKKILTEKQVDVVVVSGELYKSPEVIKQLYGNLSLGVSYFDLPDFYERVTAKVPVSAIGQLWFLENISEREKKYYERSKRALDMGFSLLAGVFGMALAPFIALAIKLDSPGPVIFSQTRTGQSGKTFRAMKFRTMVVGAEKNGAQWATSNDPRCTKVGRFLRKSRLDEIPQLINILRGEMSLIGPRPERPEFVEDLKKQIPFYDERHLIKPGLTGWAQVSFKYGASAADALEKLQYDLYYIKNRSLTLDFSILLKTVNIVLSGKGQ